MQIPALTDDKGRPVITQSAMKAFRQCKREFYYKYVLELSPKVHSLPLERGKWVHSLLEEHYSGRDWRPMHQQFTSKFEKLFDEEKEKLGDLPRDIERLMESYFWHYGDPEFKDHGWKVHEIEMLLEAEMPNGHVARGKFDMLVEDDYGLWLVDHKTHGRLPNWDYRMLDEQSPLYMWLARENGIPVNGFIWNYISTARMSKPAVLKSGKTFYSKDFKNETDYVTFAKAYKAARKEFPDTFGMDPDDKADIKARLEYLRSLRWNPGGMQLSPFFRRDTIEKSDEMVERVIKTTQRTSEQIVSYDFSDADYVERTPNECKGGFCSFRSLVMADLMHGDSEMIQRRDFIKKDPLAYHKGNDNLEA